MFRNLSLWGLTPGVYCVENENGQRASGHAALGHNDELAFASEVFNFASTFVSHDGTVNTAGVKKKKKKMSSEINGLGSTGFKHM